MNQMEISRKTANPQEKHHLAVAFFARCPKAGASRWPQEPGRFSRRTPKLECVARRNHQDLDFSGHTHLHACDITRKQTAFLANVVYPRFFRSDGHVGCYSTERVLGEPPGPPSIRHVFSIASVVPNSLELAIPAWSRHTKGGNAQGATATPDEPLPFEFHGAANDGIHRTIAYQLNQMIELATR